MLLSVPGVRFRTSSAVVSAKSIPVRLPGGAAEAAARHLPLKRQCRARSRATAEPRVHSRMPATIRSYNRSEEHTSELQSQSNLVCRLLLEKKKDKREHASTI